ncbi:MAG: hypothetical protein SXA11_24790 [Cyanobacteriota bacterium]|nr:hypothetical protein [Cyanobacteriota bacterium]
MAKRVNSKNTKAEILDAFSELKKEKSALESQLNQLNKDNPSAAISIDAASQVNPTLEAIKSMKSSMNEKPKLQYTIESLIMLQAGFGGAVSELSENLTSEATKLEEFQEAVAQELQELKDLHSLEDVGDETLDNLIQQYEESAKAFSEEFEERQETLQQQTTERTKAWEKEQQERERFVRERDENLNKTLERDEESYEYDLLLGRDINAEEYEENKKRLYKELEELQEEQQKQWAQREKAIGDREKEYAHVTLEVEAFEKKLEENIQSGKESGRNIGNYQAKIKADLLAKEIEGEKQVYQLRVQSFNQTIQNQEMRIQNLSKQLDSALKQVQDLAVKAIEGSSNVSSFKAMKEIALEQAKTQQKGK